MSFPSVNAERWGRWRAPYAADPLRTGRRRASEPESGLRSPFQRDRDRIIHSTAFRRLKGKTQVFVDAEGDHYRTRLTHTLEVAQVARSIARPLGLDEDLTEAIALGHDLGHPPFGHAGERALDTALAAHGGFDHNVQTLRVVTRLERRYPDFDGLNLTVETIDGLAKHSGPLGSLAAADGPSTAIAAILAEHGLDSGRHASLEAQVAAVSDDIAYDAHDLEDGLRSGVLAFDSLGEVPLVAGLLERIAAEHPGLDPERRRYELQRRLITVMIEDVIHETSERLRRTRPRDADDVRACGETICAFSKAVGAGEAVLKAFLFRHFYRSETVRVRTHAAARVVADLFAAFHADPACLPEGWRPPPDAPDGGSARRIGDYIAGMTDRYAEAEHRRLFAETDALVQ